MSTRPYSARGNGQSVLLQLAAELRVNDVELTSSDVLQLLNGRDKVSSAELVRLMIHAQHHVRPVAPEATVSAQHKPGPLPSISGAGTASHVQRPKTPREGKYVRTTNTTVAPGVTAVISEGAASPSPAAVTRTPSSPRQPQPPRRTRVSAPSPASLKHDTSGRKSKDNSPIDSSTHPGVLSIIPGKGDGKGGYEGVVLVEGKLDPSQHYSCLFGEVQVPAVQCTALQFRFPSCRQVLRSPEGVVEVGIMASGDKDVNAPPAGSTTLFSYYDGDYIGATGGQGNAGGFTNGGGGGRTDLKLPIFSSNYNSMPPEEGEENEEENHDLLEDEEITHASRPNQQTGTSMRFTERPLTARSRANEGYGNGGDEHSVSSEEEVMLPRYDDDDSEEEPWANELEKEL